MPDANDADRQHDPYVSGMLRRRHKKQLQKKQNLNQKSMEWSV